MQFIKEFRIGSREIINQKALESTYISIDDQQTLSKKGFINLEELDQKAIAQSQKEKQENVALQKKKTDVTEKSVHAARLEAAGLLDEAKNVNKEIQDNLAEIRRLKVEAAEAKDQEKEAKKK